MMRLFRWLIAPDIVPAVLIVVGTGALAGAFFFQHVLDVPPCELCIWQRWPYVALIALGAAALAIPVPHPARRVLFGVAALIAVGSAALAFYHVGVEQHWWLGTDACAPETGAGADDLEGLRQMMIQSDVVRCEDVQWALGGISLAGFNVLISVVLCLYFLISASAGPVTRRVSA